MLVTGVLGLVIVVLALTAFVAERRAAARQGRRMRPAYVATDVIGGAFGLVVAVISFTA
ncbi:MAG TPA: hypothetical protein VIG76_09715 [Amnibacterium sp.]|jgi:uncharacterized membrane protein YsdA (DUF1294 family)|uniref:hypothetical protein n=1 Tax=Amnibacterium sp. TaxID=1872496 RepID=UPI002F926E45